MNRGLVTIFVIVSITFFFSGVYITSYEIFPYNVIKNLKNDYLDSNTSNLIYYEDDVKSLIHLDSKSSIEKTRDNLNLFLWNSDSLPKTLYYNDHRPSSYDWHDNLIIKL